MTLNLNLPPDLAERLNQEAQRHGVSPDAYTVQMLQKHLVPEQRRGEVVATPQTPTNNARRATFSSALSTKTAPPIESYIHQNWKG